MTSPIVPAIALGFLLISAAILLDALLAARDGRRELARRLAMVAGRPVNGIADGTTPVWLAAGWTRLGRQLLGLFMLGLGHRWGIHSSPGKLLLIALVAAAPVWMIADAALELPFVLAALLTGVAFVLVPRQVLKAEQRNAERRFVDLFPDAIDMIIRALRAGLPISSAVRVVGNEAAAPISTVFTNLADEIEIGKSFEKALESAGERVELPDFRFLAMAMSLQHATGGNLIATLEILAEIIRKRRAVRLKVRATTAEVRMSAYLLGAIPFVVSGTLFATDPSYILPLISDRRGHLIVAAAGICLLLGFMTIRQMMLRVTKV